MHLTIPSLIKLSVEDSINSKRELFLKKLFTRWFSGLVYNQIWEDPEVDLLGLKIGPSSRVLTIASGGCNILNYLSEQPESIDAVDVNPAHVALSKLKLVALRHLPSYEEFFNFFAKADSADNVENYNRYLRDKLDSESRRFWDGRVFTPLLLGRKRVSLFASNFYNHSRSIYFLRFLSALARLQGYNLSKILDATSQEQQINYYRKFVEPVFDHPLIRFLSRLPVTLYSLGVPPQQFEEMCRQELRPPLDVYRERVERLACAFPLSKNYFTWQAFGRRYDITNQDALPRYLQHIHYATIKRQTDKAMIHYVSLADCLRSCEPGSLNRFVLLDSQDWMNDKQLTELWREIVRVGGSGSRVIFRTGGKDSVIEQRLPKTLTTRLIYHKDQSSDLFKSDRSSIYGGFHLYEIG